MHALFDTFTLMFALGLLINIGTLGVILVMSFMDDRRSSTLPRAIARPH